MIKTRIEERIDELFDKYKKLIDTYANHVESQKKFLMKVLDDTLYIPIEKIAEDIEETKSKIEFVELFIEDLEYAKTGEINKEDEDD